MNKKATSILAYIGLIFWLVAYFAGDREGAKVHLNQGLVLIIASAIFGVISAIPVIGWIVGCVGSIAVLVFAIMGIVYACQDKDDELPLIGKIQLLK